MQGAARRMSLSSSDLLARSRTARAMPRAWARMPMLLALLLALLSFSALPALAAQTPRLHDARMEYHAGQARIVMLADRAFSFDAQVRATPYRLEISLPRLSGADRLERLKVAGIVAGARLLRRGDGRLLWQVELAHPAYISGARALAAQDGQPARMEIELTRTDAATLARLLGEAAPLLPASSPPSRAIPTAAEAARDSGTLAAVQRAYRRLVEQAASTPATIGELIEALPMGFERETDARATPRAPSSPVPASPPPSAPVIVIDAGHGGRDPGAVDAAGRREKDIVLTFARTLRDTLRKRGYTIVMTREDDRFLRLRERVEVARKVHASLFISIHADKFRKRGVRGLGIYTLSEEASDAEAAALAHMENAADLIGAPALDETDDEVRDILVDLAQRETNANSHILATELVRALRGVTSLRRRPVRSAAFRVLRAPEIPSLLIELGYMTNPGDVRNMLSPRWRRQVAGRMADVIERFLKTRLALR